MLRLGPLRYVAIVVVTSGVMFAGCSGDDEPVEADSNGGAAGDSDGIAAGQAGTASGAAGSGGRGSGGSGGGSSTGEAGQGGQATGDGGESGDGSVGGDSGEGGESGGGGTSGGGGAGSGGTSGVGGAGTGGTSGVGAAGSGGSGGGGAGSGGQGAGGPCSPNPCLHQGACTPAGSGVACKCTSGYSGERCENGEGLRFTSVSDGSYHVCGILRDGRIDCRGRNESGQASPPPGVFTQVTTAGHFTCALRSSGEVVCFGRDRYGASSPPAGSFIQLSSGAYDSCGVRTNGSVACWGQRTTFPHTGTFTQVAVGAWNNDTTLVAIRTDGTLTSPFVPTGTYRWVSASTYHNCAVDSFGTVYCWGGAYSDLPIYPRWNLPGPFVKVASANDARGKSCGLKENGDAVCWEVPCCGMQQSVVTTNYPGPFIDLDTEEEQLCVVRANGTIGCTGGFAGATPTATFMEFDAGWGRDCGILPDRSAACYSPAGLLISSLTLPAPMADVAAGDMICGLTADGSAISVNAERRAEIVAAPSGTYTHIASGYPFNPDVTYQGCCAVRVDGALVCWDSDGEGAAPSGTFTRVSLSAKNGCAVRTDGSVHCWGENRLGQSSPPSGSFRDVSTGPNHACAIRTDGTLACWGRNDNGEATPPSGTFTRVSAAGGHTCALATDGQVRCFGSNNAGQINAPAGRFSRVTAGDTYSCALAEDQTLTCWGDRGQGYSPL